MDDKYFDDELKKILESPPDFQPDKTAINDLKNRLESLHLSKRNRVSWRSLLFLLLLFFVLGGGFIFYEEYNRLKNEVQQLSQQLINIQDEESIDSSIIIKKRIIYEIDTIYHIINQQNTIKSVNNSLSIPNHQLERTPPNNFSNLSYKNWDIVVNGKKGINNNLKFDTDFSSNLLMDGLDTKNSIPTNYGILTSIEQQEIGLLETNLLLELDKYYLFSSQEKKKNLHLVDYFSPQDFQIEINVAPLIFPNHQFGGNAFAYGLLGAIDFPKGRSIKVGLELLNMNFSFNDANNFSDLPIPDPSDPNDDLHEIYGNLSYLQIPISLHQSVLNQRKIQLELGVGLTAYLPLKQNFQYEYYSSNGEYKLRSNFNERVFSFDNLRLSLGADYVINKKITLQSDLIYQHGYSLNNLGYLKLRYSALQLGLKYRF